MTSDLEVEAIHSVSDLFAAATELLTRAQCAMPRADAEILISDTLRLQSGQSLDSSRRSLDGEELHVVSSRIARRARREPLAYILGRCEFLGLDLAVDGRVMIPVESRSRLLVAVAASQPVGARVHDVGTGSGAIALAVKRQRPDLAVSGSDISAAAIAVACENAARLELDVAFTVAPGLPPGRYDLVLANLPYADQYELTHQMPPEVAMYQPHVALVTGRDSLDSIRSLIMETPDGVKVAVEHDPVHGPELRALLSQPTTLRDDQGHERVTFGVVPVDRPVAG